MNLSKHFKLTYNKTVVLLSLFVSVLLYRELYLAITSPYEVIVWAKIWKLSIIQFIVISVWTFFSRLACKEYVAGINYFYWFIIGLVFQAIITIVLIYCGFIVEPNFDWNVLTKYPIYALYISVLCIFTVHSFLNMTK